MAFGICHPLLDIIVFGRGTERLTHNPLDISMNISHIYCIFFVFDDIFSDFTHICLTFKMFFLFLFLYSYSFFQDDTSYGH